MYCAQTVQQINEATFAPIGEMAVRFNIEETFLRPEMGTLVGICCWEQVLLGENDGVVWICCL